MDEDTVTDTENTPNEHISLGRRCRCAASLTGCGSPVTDQTTQSTSAIATIEANTPLYKDSKRLARLAPPWERGTHFNTV